jgi:hypothetical protein
MSLVNKLDRDETWNNLTKILMELFQTDEKCLCRSYYDKLVTLIFGVQPAMPFGTGIDGTKMHGELQCRS